MHTFLIGFLPPGPPPPITPPVSVPHTPAVNIPNCKCLNSEQAMIEGSYHASRKADLFF